MHPDPVAFFIAEPVAVAERAAVRPALGPAVDTSDGIGPGVALAVRATDAIAPALTELMLAMNDPETPFLDSVERRRPGTSLRGYRMFVGSPFTKRFMMVRPTFSPYARISPPPPFGAVLPTHTPMTMSGL
ncbi:MAG: hypothetical protein E6J46_11795 [Chloroflexi bacterium]|nr:MAG: hypothetical protein E6J46_11795 [Chloroflexota bacterium]